MAIKETFESLGFTILVEKEHRAVTLSNLIYPKGLDDVKFRNTFMEERIIVAGDIGVYTGKMFRISHIGSININDEVAVLGVIERALVRCGHNVE